MQAIGSCDFSGLGAERLELLRNLPPARAVGAARGGCACLLPVFVQSTRTAAPVNEDDLLDGFEQPHIVNFQPLPARVAPRHGHGLCSACKQCGGQHEAPSTVFCYAKKPA